MATLRGATLRGSGECEDQFRAARINPPLIEVVAETREVKIERFTAQPGLTSPPGEFADEASSEFIVLLSGQMVLEYAGEDEKVTLGPGDYSTKGPKQRTRADSIADDGETVWLKVSYRGRAGKYPEFTGFGRVEEAKQAN